MSNINNSKPQITNEFKQQLNATLGAKNQNAKISEQKQSEGELKKTKIFHSLLAKHPKKTKNSINTEPLNNVKQDALQEAKQKKEIYALTPTQLAPQFDFENLLEKIYYEIYPEKKKPAAAEDTLKELDTEKKEKVIQKGLGSKGFIRETSIGPFPKYKTARSSEWNIIKHINNKNLDVTIKDGLIKFNDSNAARQYFNIPKSPHDLVNRNWFNPDTYNSYRTYKNITLFERIDMISLISEVQKYAPLIMFRTDKNDGFTDIYLFTLRNARKKLLAEAWLAFATANHNKVDKEHRIFCFNLNMYNAMLIENIDKLIEITKGNTLK